MRVIDEFLLKKVYQPIVDEIQIEPITITRNVLLLFLIMTVMQLVFDETKTLPDYFFAVLPLAAGSVVYFLPDFLKEFSKLYLTRIIFFYTSAPFVLLAILGMFIFGVEAILLILAIKNIATISVVYFAACDKPAIKDRRHNFSMT